jgi:phosphoglycerol transferase MdoB-like AlkP superfamily enzyme
MWQVIRHGLTLDLSTALYFLIVPFLAAIISIWWRGKVLIKILQVYFLLIAFAFALAFVADTSLYPFWGFKLDASCLQYLDTPTEAMASVTTAYLVWRVIAILIVASIISIGYLYIVRSLRTKSPHGTDKKSAAFGLIIFILMIPPFIIGIRGGLDESTTNIGQVYFSQNQFLNHSAVNPVFSFLASFEKTASNNTIYNFMDDQTCEQIIKNLYNTESIDCDTLLNTQTPNIILILLEGCGGEFTEIGGRQDITPNLNRLAKEGVYFTNCYGNTWRTDRGTVCTWSGYPSFPTMSVMKIPSKSRTMPNIAKTLREERGYNTFYLYGGDINFTNMRSYLISGGFEQLMWKEDYTSKEQKTAQWGVCDEITFKSLFELSQSQKSPFIIGYSTLSSHAPWDVPIRKFDDEILNAFYYLDTCLGDFIERFRKTKVWDNTLVILLPDHGIPYKDIDERHPLMNHIPMIWVGGVVKEPRRIEQVCNQTDLPATLLGQLGMNHDQFTFSRDVLSKSYTQPFAIHTYDDGFSVIDSTGFVCFDLIYKKAIAEIGKKSEHLIQQGKAILQATSKDLDKR